ncbi:MAG: hypothetical protein ABSC73_02660 [Acidimicrobiales bacterium]|jgi:hypothetical protein
MAEDLGIACENAAKWPSSLEASSLAEAARLRALACQLTSSGASLAALRELPWPNAGQR